MKKVFIMVLLFACLGLGAMSATSAANPADTPDDVAWTLLLDSADTQGLRIRVKVQNTGTTTWSYDFPSDPFIKFSINGSIIEEASLPVVTTLTLQAGQVRYFTFNIAMDIPEGNCFLQTFVVLNDSPVLHPVGESVYWLISSVSYQTIGSGDQLSRVPVDFYWRNNLYECIYTAEQLEGATGWLQGIALYNDFSQESIPGFRIRIFMGHTLEDDLSGGWIPASELISVYDDPVDFPLGQNQIKLYFPNPIALPQDRNLVLLVNRTFNNSMFSLNEPFLAQNCPLGMARKYSSDSINLDPYNPPVASDSQLIDKTPLITLIYMPAPLDISDPESPSITLLQNSPNPFTGRGNLKYQLNGDAHIRLELYNVKGQRVQTISENYANRGINDLTWEIDNSLSTGIYFIKLSSGELSVSHKLMYIK